jgi:hypothetical protein
LEQPALLEASLLAKMSTFDFDDVQHWGPRLATYLSAIFPLTSAGDAIRDENPEFVEDASEIFFRVVCADKAAFNAAVWGWIKEQTVAAYHGSRLEPQISPPSLRTVLGLCLQKTGEKSSERSFLSTHSGPRHCSMSLWRSLVLSDLRGIGRVKFTRRSLAADS